MSSSATRRVVWDFPHPVRTAPMATTGLDERSIDAFGPTSRKSAPAAMASDALMQPESRDAYFRLLGDGWTDALATHNPEGGIWTYWDYQAGAWQRDHGFRIDHALLSPELADRLVACGVDKAHRGREKASDHAPVWVELHPEQ